MADNLPSGHPNPAPTEPGRPNQKINLKTVAHFLHPKSTLLTHHVTTTLHHVRHHKKPSPKHHTFQNTPQKAHKTVKSPGSHRGEIFFGKT
jgi:hypothetical protein